MRVLNLYSGLGGNRKLWEGVSVVAVEIDPRIAEIYQRHNPDDLVIVGDAHQYLLDHHSEFDFIWSSPPCQSHSSMDKANYRNAPRYAELDLYQEIIFLQNYFSGKYVVENVRPYYPPLLPAISLGRHLFWSNFHIGKFDVPRPDGFINKQNQAAKRELMDWLGIHYEENIYYGENHDPTQILRNCVHPLLGKHIFDCAFSGDLFSGAA